MLPHKHIQTGMVQSTEAKLGRIAEYKKSYSTEMEKNSYSALSVASTGIAFLRQKYPNQSSASSLVLNFLPAA